MLLCELTLYDISFNSNGFSLFFCSITTVKLTHVFFFFFFCIALMLNGPSLDTSYVYAYSSGQKRSSLHSILWLYTPIAPTIVQLRHSLTTGVRITRPYWEENCDTVETFFFLLPVCSKCISIFLWTVFLTMERISKGQEGYKIQKQLQVYVASKI